MYIGYACLCDVTSSTLEDSAFSPYSTLNRSQPSRQPSANDVDSAILPTTHLLLDYLSYPTIRRILSPSFPVVSPAEVFVSLPSSSRLAAADVPSGSDGRTGRHTKSRIPRLFLVIPVLSSSPPFPSFSSFLPSTCSCLSSYPSPVSLSYSFRALSTVISTERRRLSFQPSFHSTLQKPASPTAHPIPPSFAYPTYEAKNSILWYRLGRLLAQDVWREAGIFIPVGAPKAMSRER